MESCYSLLYNTAPPHTEIYIYHAHPAKIELNKSWLPKQKTTQNCNIDAQGFKKQEMKILPRRK